MSRFDRHGSGVDAQDVGTSVVVWQTELDSSVKTTGSEEGRIESVRSVGSHENLDVFTCIETV